MGVIDGVRLGRGVSVGGPEGVAVSLGEGVAVGVGVSVAVGFRVGVAVAVTEGDVVDLAMDVAVAAARGVPGTARPAANPTMSASPPTGRAIRRPRVTAPI